MSTTTAHECRYLKAGEVVRHVCTDPSHWWRLVRCYCGRPVRVPGQILCGEHDGYSAVAS